VIIFGAAIFLFRYKKSFLLNTDQLGQAYCKSIIMEFKKLYTTNNSTTDDCEIVNDTKNNTADDKPNSGDESKLWLAVYQEADTHAVDEIPEDEFKQWLENIQKDNKKTSTKHNVYNNNNNNNKSDDDDPTAVTVEDRDDNDKIVIEKSQQRLTDMKKKVICGPNDNILVADKDLPSTGTTIKPDVVDDGDVRKERSTTDTKKNKMKKKKKSSSNKRITRNEKKTLKLLSVTERSYEIEPPTLPLSTEPTVPRPPSSPSSSVTKTQASAGIINIDTDDNPSLSSTTETSSDTTFMQRIKEVTTDTTSDLEEKVRSFWKSMTITQASAGSINIDKDDNQSRSSATKTSPDTTFLQIIKEVTIDTTSDLEEKVRSFWKSITKTQALAGTINIDKDDNPSRSSTTYTSSDTPTDTTPFEEAVWCFYLSIMMCV
jgi:hypothetical protein